METRCMILCDGQTYFLSKKFNRKIISLTVTLKREREREREREPCAQRNQATGCLHIVESTYLTRRCKVQVRWLNSRPKTLEHTRRLCAGWEDASLRERIILRRYFTTSKRNTESSPVNDTVVVRNQESRPSFLFSQSFKTKLKGGLYKRKKSRAHWGKFYKEREEKNRIQTFAHLSCLSFLHLNVLSTCLSLTPNTTKKDGLYKRNKPIAHWGRFQKKREGEKKNQRKQHCTSPIPIFPPSQCEGHRDTVTYLYSWTSSKYFSEYWICGMFSKLQCNGCTQARNIACDKEPPRVVASHLFLEEEESSVANTRERREKRQTQWQQKQQYQTKHERDSRRKKKRKSNWVGK